MQCAMCKGKLLCGRVKCPLLQKFEFLESIKIDNHIDDPTPPSAFVGRIGYPKVYAGSLVALNGENASYLDSPWMWEGSVDDVMRLRTSLVRTTKRLDVNTPSNPDYFLLKVQEATASIKPIEIDAKVVKVNKKLLFNDTLQPMGFNAIVENFNVVDNPKIPKEVEKVYYDDLKASKAVLYLRNRGFSTYYIQKLFSVGMFGERRSRKLVPTRWSITAVHDIIGEWLKRQITHFKAIEKYVLFNFEHFGNHFEVLLSPGEYSFQLIEIWIKKSFWSPEKTWIGVDKEDLTKKKEYSALGGGYYAARLPVLEYLYKIKRKASILVIREIKPEYYAPLGVWVVEEGIRKALRREPQIFENYNLALTNASSRILTDLNAWKRCLTKVKQHSLSSFF